ncbi:unnamed protein product [Didymodactylos carnosus]|uniref:UBC core domain-containing protein n=1 Tax=Didymodactylos carnosus TaxID=1234261 RepID=A0A814MAZ2_9BILA|nr:unnamed protein product [Didymodactylos carnosus]CAF1077145.1 unnamed protein product [Didymodactylos carnosus]CAF3819826.1 unnamed protein product [Didymodactylos carnosus]CAF3843506.1 unnamed protein product [Didymodactylos carnosus]
MNRVHIRLYLERDSLISDEVKSYFILERLPDQLAPSPNGTFKIIGRLLPRSLPYSNGSYRIEITVPCAFPFACPIVKFLTPLHHIALDCSSFVVKECCCCVLGAWSPSYKISAWIKRHVDLIDNIELCGDHVRMDIDREKVNEETKEYVAKYALPRILYTQVHSLKSLSKQLIQTVNQKNRTLLEQQLPPTLMKYVNEKDDL